MDVQDSRIRRLAIGLCIAGLAGVLVAGGALFFFTDAFTPATPAIVFALPPSLDELAVKYPEIASVLQDPALGSAYKEFLIAYQQGGLPAAEKLAYERGLLNQQRQVQITLVLDSPDSIALVTTELKQLGVIIEGTYDEFVDIAVPLPLIEKAAKSENPGQIFKQLSTTKHVIKIRLPIMPRSDKIGLFSEGVSATGAEAWHQAGFTGKGVKIGVLDMGFDGYKDLLGKELPTRVTAKSFVSAVELDQTDEDHGTLCAEVVSAMAPDAELFLAYYNGRSAAQRQAVDWLVGQGVQIVSHSVGATGAPMDGTGSEARFVDTIAAKNILWVNSAGNDAGSHYRATVNQGTDQWLTFPNNSSSLKVTFPAQLKATNVVLRWDDWSGNATQDLDLFFYDEKGTLVAHSDDAQNGVQGDQPVEFFQLKSLQTRTYLIKVLAKRLTRAVIFDLYAYNGSFAYATPDYSLGTPADARGALAVGAINWRDSSLEPFSSRGPTTDGRLKPELVAPDRVNTSQGSFAGTSAAAPHVSGAAALVWSRFPQMSAIDVEAYLQTNTIDMGPKGPDMEYGYGRLQLPAPTALPSITQVVVTPSRVPPTIVIPSATTVAPTTTPVPTIIALTATPIATTVAVVPPPPAPTTVLTPQAAPRPPDSQRSDAMIGAIAILGLLMCGGILCSAGGLTMLFLLTRKPTAAPPRILLPPSPPVTPRPPAPYPSAPQLPVMPRVRSLALVGPTGQRIGVPIGINAVGRSSSSPIRFEEPAVSRQHARISWDGVHATVTDLGSTNGTFVNGRRLMPNVLESLRAGDCIAFGGAMQWLVVIG